VDHANTEIDGIWKPWRHRTFRDVPHPLQGWWRHRESREHVAVLGDAGESSTGNSLVVVSYYNADGIRRGNGTRMLAERVEREFDRMPENFDPRIM
jgi:hypothetical protein